MCVSVSVSGLLLVFFPKQKKFTTYNEFRALFKCDSFFRSAGERAAFKATSSTTYMHGNRLHASETHSFSRG